MNLLIVNDTTKVSVEEIAKAIWESDKSFLCAKIDGISGELEKFSNKNKVILTIDLDNIYNISPNDVYKYLDNTMSSLIIVTDDDNHYSRAHEIFYTFEEIIKDTIMYITNDELLDFDEFIQMSKSVLLKKADYYD